MEEFLLNYKLFIFLNDFMILVKSTFFKYTNISKKLR